MAVSSQQLDLLDPAFIERAKALRIVARRVAPGGRWADQRSLDRGSGLEFRDYRPYSAGDDLRAIDWNIYRRLGRVVLRLFEELEDLPIYLIPDVSRSMWMERPPRAHAAFRAVVAMAAIGLDQHDAVGVFPFGEQLEIAAKPRSGRGRLLEFASLLNGIASQQASQSQQTNLVASVARFSSLGLRDGLAVIVSDFFDPAGAGTIVRELKRLRHRVLLMPITRATDRRPDVSGDLRVRDCETRETFDVTITDEVLNRYTAAYDRHMGELEAFARSRMGGFLPLDADEDVLSQLSRLFDGGRYVA